jgi:PAS domain S-box-containing protein
MNIDLQQEFIDDLRRRSEDHTLGLSKGKDHAIFILDSRGNIVTWNDSAEQVTGFTESEVIGQNYALLYPANDRENNKPERNLERAEREGKVEDQLWQIRKDGSRFWASIVIVALHPEEPHLSGYVQIITDATEKQRIEEERHIFVALAEKSTDFIGMCDMDWVPFFVNEAGMELVGFDHLEQALQTPVQEFFFPEDQAFIIEEFFPHVRRNGRGEIEIRFRHFKTGKPIWMRYNVFYLKDGDGTPIGFATVSQNITDRKRAEEAWRASEEHYRTLFNSIDEGFCIVEMLFDNNNNPIDYRFVEVNPAFEKQTGLINAQGKRIRELRPQHENYWFEIYGKIALTGEAARFERQAGQLQRWYDVYAFRFGEPDQKQVAILFKDITARKSAEDALVRSEEKLRLITDAVPSLISYVDHEAHYILCNKAYETWFGLPRSEIIGSPMVAILGEKAWGKIGPRIQRALSGEIVTYEAEVLYKTAGRRWIDARYIPQFDPHQRVQGVAVLVNDITARKDAEEALKRSEEELRLFFDLGPIGMVEADPNTKRFSRVNQKFCEITGYSAEELLKMEIEDITHPEDNPQDVEIISQMLSRELDVYSREKRYVRKDGSIVWVSVFGKIIFDKDGHPDSSIATVEDISQRKESEEALRQSRIHLEQVVEERTSELRSAVEELRRSNKELEAFAYIASHDLQEPLRMVTSYVQLIQHNIKTGQLGDHIEEYIAYAVDSVARMRRLISDLLDYSRVRSRPLQIQALSIEDPLKEAISNLQVSIKESQAQITHDPLPVLPGDRMKIVQLFQNLLSNAIKFRSDKPPRIHVSASPLNENCWQFSVYDNGIGIGAEYRDTIFQIFQRLHPREKYSGTGIGLAICRSVVERHEGKIWVDPNPEGGSIFRFTLPMKLPIRKVLRETETRFSPEVI